MVHEMGFRLRSLTLFLANVNMVVLVERSRHSTCIRLITTTMNVVVFYVVVGLVRSPSGMGGLELPTVVYTINLLNMAVIFNGVAGNTTG